jgi:hypothetical protein
VEPNLPGITPRWHPLSGGTRSTGLPPDGRCSCCVVTTRNALGVRRMKGRHRRPRPNLIARLRVVAARVVAALSRQTPPQG